MIISFTRPEYLMLLLAIPVLIFVHIISLKSIRKRSIKFANFEAISKIKGVEIFSKNLTVLYINIAIIILVVFAVSGISITRTVKASKVSFVIAIDSSWSMEADDIEPTRLEAAKQAAKDFLDMLPEKTNMGVVSFSGVAFIEQDLTEDKTQTERAIGDIEINYVGGTDILGAITSSSNLLRDEEAKVIVLMSDGQANINTLQDIIDYSNRNQVIVHSLGVGTERGSVEESGASFRISEDTLKTISHETGGEYYNIQNVQDFYSSLNQIAETRERKGVYDLDLYLMITALILFLLNFALINTRYRILP
jgi:Ca-activated chloride channel family protein